MRAPVAVALAALLAMACSKSDSKPNAAAAEAAGDRPAGDTPGTPAEPKAPAVAEPPAPPPPPPKPKLQIQLRSTPPGAETQVDGKPAGLTPTTVDIDDDGKEHEFVFLMPGYAMERYRTRPLKSGVIHAKLRGVPGAPAADAGP